MDATKRLHDAIRAAMLAWLLNLPDMDRHWGHDWNEPDGDPVEVTGWEELPCAPDACSTCAEKWPVVIIRYRTRRGDEATYEVDDDFGAFIRELCA